MTGINLLLVGNLGGTNVAASLMRSAIELGINVDVLETKSAYNGSFISKKINWWLKGKKPCNMNKFEELLLNKVSQFQPYVVLTVGISPPSFRVCNFLVSKGIKLINFLTDDPWQKNRSNWFINSLCVYSAIFSTKKRVLVDCIKENRNSYYMPFAYDPFFIKKNQGISDGMCSGGNKCEIFFAGGADNDRFPIIKCLINNGFKVGVHGDYWNRDRLTEKYWYGHGTPEMLDYRTKSSDISLCMVRRANRDGHVMRTFEAAASKGCMLVESTDEHRDIFGEDGECVVYFLSDAEMIIKAKWLLDHPEERFRLRKAVYNKIVLKGQNTYHDRLKTMLEITKVLS